MSGNGYLRYEERAEMVLDDYAFYGDWDEYTISNVVFTTGDVARSQGISTARARAILNRMEREDGLLKSWHESHPRYPRYGIRFWRLSHRGLATVVNDE